jgi:high-affinity Fe2+/Pb2+ permease
VDERQQRRAQAMLHNGITGFAMLAGLACYLGAMALFRFSQLAAVIAGFVFALLVWIAARSLLRDLLLEAARSQAEQAEANRQPHQRTTPPPPQRTSKR